MTKGAKQEATVSSTLKFHTGNTQPPTYPRLIIPIIRRSASDTLQQALIHIPACEQILRPIRRAHIDPTELDVRASSIAAAPDIPADILVLAAGGALDVTDDHVPDLQTARELLAQRQVLLAVALRDLDGVVGVVDRHGVVDDVLDAAAAAAALEVAGEGGGGAGPGLDAGAVGDVCQRVVVHQNVLDDVVGAFVLAQTADGDAVGAGAGEALDEDAGRVGLEADAVVAVVDDRVLDDDVGRAVRVPAVGVLGRVGGGGAAGDGEVGEDDVGAVGDPVVVLWGVAEVEVGDDGVLEAGDAHEHGAEDVDVGGVQVVPDLAVAVDGTAAVHGDAATAELEEGGDVLEGLEETGLLPVGGVVGEQPGAADVEVDVFEEGQVERGADEVGLVGGEDDMAAVVAVLDGGQDGRGVIGLQVIVRWDRASLAVSGGERWDGGKGSLGLDFDIRSGVDRVGLGSWCGEHRGSGQKSEEGGLEEHVGDDA